MSRKLFWLSDEEWEQIEPHLPRDVRGKERANDRRVISGIVHVLKSGCRWCDCPEAYGPPTTIYNRFSDYSGNGTGPGIELGLWDGMNMGRFAVARAAARLFPTKKRFVQEGEDEGEEDFPRGPYPDDNLTRRSDTDVEFETPAHKDGMGTFHGLVKNAGPIR